MVSGAQIGRIAALMSKAYRAINLSIEVLSKSAFVYLNQYRMNPGDMEILYRTSR